MAVFDILARLKIDKGDAESTLASLAGKSAGLADALNVPVKVDTNSAVQSIAAWKASLIDLKAQRDKAEDTGSLNALNAKIATAEQQVKAMKTPMKDAFDQKPVDDFTAALDKIPTHIKAAEHEGTGFAEHFKEGLKTVAEFATGGLLANGIGGIATEIAKDAQIAHDASTNLSVGLSRTTLSAAAQKEEFARLGEKAEVLADKFALTKANVMDVQGKIAGFSGLSGAALDHLTELAIGASNGLQMSAEGVARMIARGADPEQEASLARMGITFDKNATSAERMAIIEQKLGPSIAASEAAANDAVGTFTKWKNAAEEMAIGLAVGVVGALKGLSGFVGENKVAFGLLAVGIGAVTLMMNAATISAEAHVLVQKVQLFWTDGLAIAQKAYNLVLLNNPIGWIITGIMALAVTMAFLYNKVGFVKDAIDGLWSGIKSVASVFGLFGDSVDESAGKLDKEGTAAESAGVASANAAALALEAQQKLLASIDDTVKAYADQEGATKKNVDNSISLYAQIQKRLAEGGALDTVGVFRKDTEEMKATLQDRLGAWDTYGQKQAAIQKENEDRDKAAHDHFLPEAEKEKAVQSDFLNLAKQTASAEAAAFEVKLKRQRIQEGVAFSSSDELAVQQKLTGVFEDQIVAMHDKIAALDGQKLLKFNAGLNLERAQQDLKNAELTVKVNADATALETSLIKAQQAAEDVAKKHQQDIYEIEHKNAVTLAGINISLMDAGYDHDKAALDQKLSEDLTANVKNQDIKDALQAKYQKDLIALQKKGAKDEFDIAKTTTDALLDLYHGYIADRKAMDASEITSKRQGYNDERTALEASLQKGEVSYAEYNAKLGKLTDDRGKFEAQVTEESKSRIAVAIDGSLVKAQSAIEKEAETYITGQLQQLLMGQAAETAKTDSSAAGWAVREAIIGAEILAKGLATAATILWAEAEVVLGWVIANPLVGVPIGLAVAAGMVAGIHALGYADGGVTRIVGERGIEVIAPGTDFSQMVSQLVTQTATITERTLIQQNTVTGQNGRVGINFTGQARVEGRTLNLVAQREAMSQSRERLLTN